MLEGLFFFCLDKNPRQKLKVELALNQPVYFIPDHGLKHHKYILLMYFFSMSSFKFKKISPDLENSLSIGNVPLRILIFMDFTSTALDFLFLFHLS